MKAENLKGKKVQTLHPEKGKTNRPIAADKYETVKAAILKAIRQKELTHTELLQNVNNQLEKRFDGNIGWYLETVKLDLEARRIIKRTKQTRPTYQIENQNEH